MAVITKTFDLSAGNDWYRGTKKDFSSTATSYTNTVSTGDPYGYFVYGINIYLEDAFGTDNGTVKKMTISYAGRSSLTGSIYTAGTVTSGYGQLINSSGTYVAKVIHEKGLGKGSFISYTDTITDCSNCYLTLNGKTVISPGIEVRNYNILASEQCTIQNISFTIEYEVPDEKPTWEYKAFPNTNNCFITKYNGSDTNVTVPSTLDGYTVTRLGYGFHVNDFGEDVAANKVTGATYYGTFSENSTITSVTIPSTVNWIGYQTFRKCTALKTISWNPSEPCIIGHTSINNCTSLTNFTVPDNIKEVYAYAFQNSTGLTRLDFKNKTVVFKTANNDNTVPTNMFSGTSDSLVIGLYHNIAETISDAITGKSIYYFDASVVFISDETILKSDYVDIGAKPIAPTDPTKDDYTFSGWSDGTSIYPSSELPLISNDASGAIDVTYTAIFEPDKINKIYIGKVQPKGIYIGTQPVKAVYIGTTKIYG